MPPWPAWFSGIDGITGFLRRWAMSDAVRAARPPPRLTARR
jgi:hypothetical protein